MAWPPGAPCSHGFFFSPFPVTTLLAGQAGGHPPGCPHRAGLILSKKGGEENNCVIVFKRVQRLCSSTPQSKLQLHLQLQLRLQLRLQLQLRLKRHRTSTGTFTIRQTSYSSSLREYRRLGKGEDSESEKLISIFSNRRQVFSYIS